MTKGNMNRRTMLRGAALGALATPALVGKGIAQGKVNWRVQAHWPKASSSFTDSLGKLAEVLEARTEGAFKMDLLGAGEFAKGPDIYNIVRKGVVPMGTVSPSYVQDQAQAASFLFGIPGTFRQAWEMEHAVKNLGLEALVNEDLNADGVMMKTEKVLPVEIVVSKKIESAEDFKGLKLRSSGTMLDYLQSAGAAPQYIPGSELYQSLSSGVVDGAHWGAAVGAKSMSLWEVCKYHYKPALGQTTDAFILNMEAVDGLEDDLRTALLDTMETRFFQRSAEYQHAEAIAISSGIAENDIEVSELPDDVLAILADASAKILDTEAQKGERAAKAADIYKTLMTDLGYL
ncbi:MULTISPECIES: TRAP transporter substrate-binding protein [Sulfitobacter]|jgi:TRAP-type mannitol/chloroaromatic compound transport system substrate-binding protein|uniref:TRAP transporter substrate-binding protein n=2 Tax=Sulfitobacter TaxID=60136 RepID=A0AAU8C3V6_9RHOB|nr:MULTISPECIES: TRAP transporter substrate-binding protein [Sulfitobacter]PTA97900.1 ABC transporter substrate-binding protein [Sulfitobacter sp. CB-A]ULO19987.1 TRAP transporter substrate-binding protein DctP [Sulfitobacter sp. CB2047]BDY14667.1 C4-dicarboxylate ABC transporter [Sulfitobacter pontiacus]